MKWSVVCFLPDINLFLHFCEALFHVESNSFLVNLVHSCGVSLVRLLLPSLFRGIGMKKKKGIGNSLCDLVHRKGGKLSFLTL